MEPEKKSAKFKHAVQLTWWEWQTVSVAQIILWVICVAASVIVHKRASEPFDLLWWATRFTLLWFCMVITLFVLSVLNTWSDIKRLDRRNKS